eukprot:TRINITY_DN1363_c7_g1_i1.p1 TRINITY_DN1363_c7_g1~~TRINITY_DN1363_c7_g1_i1.p1  ORF type:complete len:786 (+),score=65.66 TRINITY_DN1363_c7_g1_i1:23-2359(+)
MLTSPTHVSSFLTSASLHQARPHPLPLSEITIDSPSESSDFSSFNIPSANDSMSTARSAEQSLGRTRGISVFGNGSSVKSQSGRRPSTHRRANSLSMLSCGRHRRRVGRYRKGKELGSGATGTVYQGIDQLTGVLVAIKEVKQELDKNIQREFELLQKLLHPNIVRYFDYESHPNHTSTIYMELVDGGSLASLVHEYGKLSEPVLKQYMKQVTDGLGYLHSRDVIHRDIKPGNLLVTTNGVVKLADFGTSKKLSTVSEETVRRVSKDFVGTPIYASPEAIRGDYCFASDIWSMGVTFVELATGDNPWDGVIKVSSHLEFILKLPTQNIRPRIPRFLTEDAQDFISLCLERMPEARPSCAELLEHRFLTNFECDPFDSQQSEAVCKKDVLAFSMNSVQTISMEGSTNTAEPPDLLPQSSCSEIRGLFIAAHCCNDDQANIVFERIQDRSSNIESSLTLSRPFTPCLYSPVGSSFNKAVEYAGVDGTPDGLITLHIPEESRDSSFKFDVFFGQETSPFQLYQRIGEPILDNMLNGRHGKKISLTCSAMMYAGESCMTIGKMTKDIDIFSREGQGFTPIIMTELFKKCSHTHDIYVSSISAKRDKNAVFDNIHKVAIDDRDVIWGWGTLGPVIRRKTTSVEEAFVLMDLAQLAFAGVMAPQMYVIEIREKTASGGAPMQSTLFLNLYYGRQWIYWLNGITHVIKKYFAYGEACNDDALDNSATLDENRMYRHPLLVLTEEVYRDENSMNYILHNFHTKVQDNIVDDVTSSLDALSTAARKR